MIFLQLAPDGHTLADNLEPAIVVGSGQNNFGFKGKYGPFPDNTVMMSMNQAPAILPVGTIQGSGVSYPTAMSATSDPGMGAMGMGGGMGAMGMGDTGFAGMGGLAGPEQASNIKYNNPYTMTMGSNRPYIPSATGVHGYQPVDAINFPLMRHTPVEGNLTSDLEDDNELMKVLDEIDVLAGSANSAIMQEKMRTVVPMLPSTTLHCNFDIEFCSRSH